MNTTDEEASRSFLDDLPTGVTVGIFVGLFLVVIFICFCVIYCVCNRPLRSNSNAKGKQQFTMTNRVELQQEMTAGKMDMSQMELSFSNPLQKTRKKEKGSQNQSVFDDDDQTDLRKTPVPGLIVGGEGTNQLTLGRQFVPSNLPNDISPKEKQLTIGRQQNPRQTPNASLSGSQIATNTMSTMPKSNKHNTMTASTMSRATNDGASGKELVDKLVIAGDSKQRTERRKRGLSYGRLDQEAQQRIASIRLQAEDILKPIQIGSRPEDAHVFEQEGENAFPIPLSPQQNTAPASKEDIKKKIKRIAQGAGGGIYTTGGSTAALSGEIIGGFQERRKKRENTDMNLRDLENGAWRAGDGSSAPPPSPQRSEFQSSQPPSPVSSSRTHRNVIQLKPGQTKLGAFLESTTDSSPETDL